MLDNETSRLSLEGYEEIGGESTSRVNGLAEPKALIPEHLNEFAKRECKLHNQTASQYLGSLLAPAIEAAMKESKTEKRRLLEETFGPGWLEVVKEVI